MPAVRSTKYTVSPLAVEDSVAVTVPVVLTLLVIKPVIDCEAVVGVMILVGIVIQMLAFALELVAQVPVTGKETDLIDALMPLRESPAKMASIA